MEKQSNIVALIDKCCREWRQLIEHVAKQHKLTFSQWRVLVCVAEVKNLEQQTLSRELSIAPNNVVNIVDGLVNKGFIKKTIKASDKKIRILTITKKKSALVNQIKKLDRQIQRSWMSPFNKKALESFEESLWQALDSVQSVRDKFI